MNVQRAKASLLHSDGEPMEELGEWRVIAIPRTDNGPAESGVMLHLGHPWLDDIGRTRDELAFHGAISLSPESARKLAEALLLAANLSAPTVTATNDGELAPLSERDAEKGDDE